MNQPKYCELRDEAYIAELLAAEKRSVSARLRELLKRAEALDDQVTTADETSSVDSLPGDIVEQAREVVARINEVMKLKGDNFVNDWLTANSDRTGGLQVARAGIGIFLEEHDPEFQEGEEQ